MNLFYIHWNEDELKEKTKPLENAGYKVNYHFSTKTDAEIKDNLPHVLIICIDRLPSHGKAYAEWMWEAKKRQHIPIIFCGGKPDKIKTMKEKFPKAIFCSNEELIHYLQKL